MKKTATRSHSMNLSSFYTLLLITLLALTSRTYAADIEGKVLIAGKPVSGSTVTLYVAGEAYAKKLDQGKTDEKGYFKIHDDHILTEGIFYLVANGGTVSAATTKASSDGLELLAVLGSSLQHKIIVNEFSTVASAYTFAQFIHGESITGNKLGLKIAAGNVPHFVNLSTGSWGNTIVDPLNSTQSTALATFNTLSSLISGYATVADKNWQNRFLKASTPGGSNTTPGNTLDAMAGIARSSWSDPKTLFALFDEIYPQPANGSRRSAPFVPYLAYAPDDFALMLCFSGGGMCANGRFMFDAEGNLWSGQNWMPGSQSGVIHSIGGGVLKMTPNGKALSPEITGFTGMGIDGIGWGTAVTKDRVWASSFNGKILVMDFNGKPVATEADFPFKEKFLGLMGIGVAANGDVWIADGSDNQLLFFPGGRIKEGKIVKVAGLKSPFDIVIDPQNRVYVSNSQSETVLRFPASDPSKVETYRCGLVVRALALDSKGNVWVASNTSLDFPMPKVPDGASIMEQFEIMGDAMLTYPKSTGTINLIKADGTQPFPDGFTGGGAVDVPWGLNIDGNDDVWLGNLAPRARSVTLLAGENTKGHPTGTKTGDLIHEFKSGTIQMLTDVAIDPAGNIWAANNWNDPIAATSKNPVRATSTWGGGSGLTIIYGVASPVKPPRMGIVRRY
jgi:hypothetical protein